MKNSSTPRLSSIAFGVMLALGSGGVALAQEEEDVAVPAVPVVEPQEEEIEEVVVLGRFISSSQQLVNERMNDAFATDLLGADTISRLGDSTVAFALRRVPGLSLVQDRFVYIRGLGERYTTTTLNGAAIPSPDLTRNVIPLDVFPTAVVESLRVQKSYSPAQTANFGGGSVDIRTKGIPDAFTLKFELGTGFNSENPSKVASYPGGGDDNLGTDDGSRALSPAINNALTQYQGNPSVNNIFVFEQRQDPATTFFDAQTINRDLALELNRNIGIEQKSPDPDITLRASVGNKFDVGANWGFGFNLGGSYQSQYRWRQTRTASLADPVEQTGVREETTHSVNIAGTLNLGATFMEDHTLAWTTLALRNTDNETEIFDFFNENRPKPGGIGFRDYRLEFEERNMVTHQVRGEHYIGQDTKSILPFLNFLPDGTRIDWYYSESEAMTDIPSKVEISSDTSTDRDTGEVLSERVRLTSSAADYRFTDLDDEVINYAWNGMVPLEFGNNYVEVSGGYDHRKKARQYYQAEFSLGYLEVSDPSVLQGPLNEVFSEERILAQSGPDEYANNAVFDRQGANTNSYFAATMTDSVWGTVDWTWDNTWRFNVGARWEDYRQAAVTWNPFGFSLDNPQIPTDVETLENSVFNEDKIYPAVGITYMGSLWADTFQLRFGYSETAVRPDLREITPSSYIDPITDDLVRGNPGIVPAEVKNFDVRAEWFFANGDNFTVSGFYKDLLNPIEFFEIPASDTTIAREVVNSESAEVYGVEFEALKELGFIGGFFDTMFVQGNLTLQDSELVAGPNANVPTNPIRPLTGASEYVVNLTLGYDSPNANHTASLVYNVFGERLFVAGRNGSADGFEQPFNSLDFTYFWYPTDQITLKVRARNILDESISIERAGITVFEESPGTDILVNLQWGF